MFEPVEGERFDLVLCNPPYLRGEPQSPAGYAYWGGDNLEWLARFAAQLHGRLSPGGVAMLSIGDVADLYGIIEILQLSGWRVDEVARRDMLFEIIHLFRLAGEFDFAG
jgi:methylase of polypeptide subunit release factors